MIELFVVVQNCGGYETAIETVTLSFDTAFKKYKENEEHSYIEVWEDGADKENIVYFKVDDMIKAGRITDA